MPQRLFRPIRSEEAILRAVSSIVGATVVGTERLAGDASTRRFFRVRIDRGGTLVAAVYPEVDEERAATDHRAHLWAFREGLPVPEPMGILGAVTLAADLGDVDYQQRLDECPDAAIGEALDALAAYQATRWERAPNAPFDTAFFRRELDVFVAHCPVAVDAEGIAFVDGLCRALECHPYRLLHRDFHVNNLLHHGGRCFTVDFQDLRGGPDTYDAVSLLRERAAAGPASREEGWRRRAASRLGWSGGWERRYRECAAQRGMKVVGTFLRLVASGRSEYRRYLPAVRERTADALRGLGAPGALLAALELPAS